MERVVGLEFQTCSQRLAIEQHTYDYGKVGLSGSLLKSRVQEHRLGRLKRVTPQTGLVHIL